MIKFYIFSNFVHLFVEQICHLYLPLILAIFTFWFFSYKYIFIILFLVPLLISHSTLKAFWLRLCPFYYIFYLFVLLHGFYNLKNLLVAFFKFAIFILILTYDSIFWIFIACCIDIDYWEILICPVQTTIFQLFNFVFIFPQSKYNIFNRQIMWNFLLSFFL